MPTLFLKGDVLDTEGLSVFALAVPTDGTLGGGAAQAFSKRFPGLAPAYAAHAAAHPVQLGDVVPWSGDGATVYLLATTSAGSASKPKLAPLARAVAKALALAIEAGHSRLGTPRLGAGLDKVRVKRMLEEETKNVAITVEVFEQFVRNPSRDPS